jgi:hypothetical protein
VDDFASAGAGSLRGRHATREPVATFTETRTLHPDEIWHPLGGGLDSRAPSLTSSVDDQGETRQRETRQRDAEPGRRPGDDTSEEFDLLGTASTIRSALRPGPMR